MANIKNLRNSYEIELGDLFDRTPKSVFAAIAVSALTCGGDYLDAARERIIGEWQVLYENGIVKQKPPAGKAAT